MDNKYSYPLGLNNRILEFAKLHNCNRSKLLLLKNLKSSKSTDLYLFLMMALIMVERLSNSVYMGTVTFHASLDFSELSLKPLLLQKFHTKFFLIFCNLNGYFFFTSIYYISYNITSYIIRKFSYYYLFFVCFPLSKGKVKSSKQKTDTI